MRPGPPPRPSALRALEGNVGHKRVNRNEPKPAPIYPGQPPWLTKAEREQWDYLAPILLKMGVLTEADGLALACLCRDLAEYVTAGRQVHRHGRTMKTKTGYEAISAWVTVRKQAGANLRQWCAAFGLTPADRTRLAIVPPEDGYDPFDALQQILASADRRAERRRQARDPIAAAKLGRRLSKT